MSNTDGKTEYHETITQEDEYEYEYEYEDEDFYSDTDNSDMTSSDDDDEEFKLNEELNGLDIKVRELKESLRAGNKDLVREAVISFLAKLEVETIAKVMEKLSKRLNDCARYQGQANLPEGDESMQTLDRFAC